MKPLRHISSKLSVKPVSSSRVKELTTNDVKKFCRAPFRFYQVFCKFYTTTELDKEIIPPMTGISGYW